MNIAINLRLLNPGKIGGHEAYVRNIIKYFLRLDPKTEFVIFATDASVNTLVFDHDRVRIVLLPSKGYGSVILQTIINSKIDCYFCPLMVLEPILVHVPTVINIPDLQHEYFPQFFTRETLEWRKLHYNASVSNSTAVLTVSEYSKETFNKELGTPKSKIYSIHLAADEVFHATLDPVVAEKVKKKYSLPDVYGYFPANTWPHKNHITLLEAIHLYKEKYEVAPKIILSGAKDSGHDSLLASIVKYQLQDDVVFLGYVPKEELPYLYHHASFLVFPSLFEGFGIPVVEALLSGCPVICSNTTSIPEVAGDAALYFDPSSPAEICERMHQVLKDDSLRSELIRKGSVRAKMFSWENTAAETSKIFHSLFAPKAAATSRPRLTVVTPSYNQGEFIEETILSVLGQGYPNLEYLVMDGGSKDQTVEILRKYEERLTWVSEKDDGQADAVNKGFRVATGEILGWLNSDDTYLPGVFEKVVTYFEQHPDVVMIYGNAYYTNKDSIITSRYPTEPYNEMRLAENCYICQPSVFIRASALREVGELDVDLRTCMDFDLWIRFSKKFGCRIAFIEDYLATSRMYEENKTLSLREKVYDEVTATVEKHYGYVATSWIYGYIVDVIIGIFLRALPLPLRPFRKVFFWFYVTRFALHLKSSAPMVAARDLQKRTIISEADTRYPDGWVAESCTISLSKRKTETAVKVTGRNLSPFDNPLKIVISVNGGIVARQEIKCKGEFGFILQLPAALLSSEVVDLHFKADRTFIPKELGINDDDRVLSFILDKIEAAS